MTVKQLIKELKKIKDQNVPVYFWHEDNDGCDTCGYGASQLEDDIDRIIDMDTKVWLKR